MKTIFKTISILFVTALVCGAFFFIVNTTSLGSMSGGEDEMPPAMTTTVGQTTMQMPQRPDGAGEGGHKGEGSSTRGLLEVLVTLGKLAGITVIVLAVKKGLNLILKKNPSIRSMAVDDDGNLIT